MLMCTPSLFQLSALQKICEDSFYLTCLLIAPAISNIEI